MKTHREAALVELKKTLDILNQSADGQKDANRANESSPPPSSPQPSRDPWPCHLSRVSPTMTDRSAYRLQKQPRTQICSPRCDAVEPTQAKRIKHQKPTKHTQTQTSDIDVDN